MKKEFLKFKVHLDLLESMLITTSSPKPPNPSKLNHTTGTLMPVQKQRIAINCTDALKTREEKLTFKLYTPDTIPVIVSTTTYVTIPPPLPTTPKSISATALVINYVFAAIISQQWQLLAEISSIITRLTSLVQALQTSSEIQASTTQNALAEKIKARRSRDYPSDYPLSLMEI